MLKLGMIHEAAGNKEQARQEYLQIKKLYPQSTAARFATERLNGG